MEIFNSNVFRKSVNVTCDENFSSFCLQKSNGYDQYPHELHGNMQSVPWKRIIVCWLFTWKLFILANWYNYLNRQPYILPVYPSSQRHVNVSPLLKQEYCIKYEGTLRLSNIKGIQKNKSRTMDCIVVLFHNTK